MNEAVLKKMQKPAHLGLKQAGAHKGERGSAQKDAEASTFGFETTLNCPGYPMDTRQKTASVLLVSGKTHQASVALDAGGSPKVVYRAACTCSERI